MHIPTITPRRIVSTCLSVGIVLANTELVTSGMPFSLSPSVPATRDTVAATLALFDGDADEATVVAPLMALRQDPVWMLALHHGHKRCAIALTHGPTDHLYRMYLKRAQGVRASSGGGPHSRANDTSHQSQGTAHTPRPTVQNHRRRTAHTPSVVLLPLSAIGATPYHSAGEARPHRHYARFTPRRTSRSRRPDGRPACMSPSRALAP